MADTNYNEMLATGQPSNYINNTADNFDGLPYNNTAVSHTELGLNTSNSGIV